MNDMTPIDIAHPQDGMRDLATRIEAEHAAVAQALQSALAHAIAAGELLIVAKRQVQHGLSALLGHGNTTSWTNQERASVT